MLWGRAEEQRGGRHKERVLTRRNNSEGCWYTQPRIPSNYGHIPNTLVVQHQDAFNYLCPMPTFSANVQCALHVARWKIREWRLGCWMGLSYRRLELASHRRTAIVFFDHNLSLIFPKCLSCCFTHSLFSITMELPCADIVKRIFDKTNKWIWKTKHWLLMYKIFLLKIIWGFAESSNIYVNFGASVETHTTPD